MERLLWLARLQEEIEEAFDLIKSQASAQLDSEFSEDDREKTRWLR
jgi:hypothetical protein